MNHELRLHGFISGDIEYYATAAGFRDVHHHFYQQLDQELRFFAGGNQLLLTSKGVQQSGSGGSICEYMFGVEQPLADLTKPGVLNRLVLLGAGYDARGELVFGQQDYAEFDYPELFGSGHAIHNFFFFVDGISAPSQQERQQTLLRLLGKHLKRMSNLNQEEDSRLCSELLKLLPDSCTIYLIRLTNARHRHFQREFQHLYYRHRSVPDSALQALQEIAASLEIAPKQEERIRFDVMYRHRDNYRIIDEYKKTLIDCHRQGQISRQQHARLTRLRTLAVRQKIPAPLLNSLDLRISIDRDQQTDQEKSYLATTRQILQGLFINPELLRQGLDQQDMAQLLRAKQQAHRNHDHSFEQLLLETGQLCDEQIRDGGPLPILENFSSMIAYLDRFESTASHISQLAFMENFSLSDSQLRSLYGNQQAFESLLQGLFQQLFFDEIFSNAYLGRYGRRKLGCLQQGLQEVSEGRLSLQQLADQLKNLNREEQLYNSLLHSLKDRIRNRYSRFSTRAEQQELYHQVSDELTVRGLIDTPLDPDLFRSVVHNLKTEAIYLQSMLPEIISRQDHLLRDDFLANSGLDRFYVEGLEKDYFDHNQIDLDHLQQLRNT